MVAQIILQRISGLLSDEELKKIVRDAYFTAEETPHFFLARRHIRYMGLTLLYTMKALLPVARYKQCYDRWMALLEDGRILICHALDLNVVQITQSCNRGATSVSQLTLERESDEVTGTLVGNAMREETVPSEADDMGRIPVTELVKLSWAAVTKKQEVIGAVMDLLREKQAEHREGANKFVYGTVIDACISFDSYEKGKISVTELLEYFCDIIDGKLNPHHINEALARRLKDLGVFNASFFEAIVVSLLKVLSNTLGIAYAVVAEPWRMTLMWLCGCLVYGQDEFCGPFSWDIGNVQPHHVNRRQSPPHSDSNDPCVEHMLKSTFKSQTVKSGGPDSALCRAQQVVRSQWMSHPVLSMPNARVRLADIFFDILLKQNASYKHRFFKGVLPDESMKRQFIDYLDAAITRRASQQDLEALGKEYGRPLEPEAHHMAKFVACLQSAIGTTLGEEQYLTHCTAWRLVLSEVSRSLLYGSSTPSSTERWAATIIQAHHRGHTERQKLIKKSENAHSESPSETHELQ